MLSKEFSAGVARSLTPVRASNRVGVFRAMPPPQAEGEELLN
jgi:hypothetical protein